MKTIVLTGGGTAGHVTPNIALLPLLKNHFDNIIYIGSYNGIEKNLLSKYPFVKFYPITTTKFQRKLCLSNLKIPWLLLKGKKEAYDILTKIKPNIIFSKGGYVSLPVILAGKKCNIPMITHESDLTMGLANKIVKNKFKKICTTFKETADHLKNGLFVGPPIQKLKVDEPQKIKNKLHLSNTKPVLTILGGSQGSNVINNLIRNNLNELTKTHQIIHLTGKNKIDNTIKNQDYHQIEYTDKIQEIFSITDLAISRGGSNSIHELLLYRIPMLLIPLTKSSRGDQIKNATYFKKKGYAICLSENVLGNDIFIEKWKELQKKSNLIKSSNKNALPNDSLNKIIKEILKYSK